MKLAVQVVLVYICRAVPFFKFYAYIAAQYELFNSLSFMIVN